MRYFSQPTRTALNPPSPPKKKKKKNPQKNIPHYFFWAFENLFFITGAGMGNHTVSSPHKILLVPLFRGRFSLFFFEALKKKPHTFFQSLGFTPFFGKNKNALFFPTKSIKQLFTQSD